MTPHDDVEDLGGGSIVVGLAVPRRAYLAVERVDLLSPIGLGEPIAHGLCLHRAGSGGEDDRKTSAIGRSGIGMLTRENDPMSTHGTFSPYRADKDDVRS